jgi:hypothetical protein
VAVAESETMFSGWASMVTSPLSPVTVTGQDDSSAAEVPAAVSPPASDEPPQPARTRGTASRSGTRGGRGDRVVRNTGEPPEEAADIAH